MIKIGINEVKLKTETRVATTTVVENSKFGRKDLTRSLITRRNVMPNMYSIVLTYGNKVKIEFSGFYIKS